MSQSTCVVSDCRTRAKARGLCSTHYTRWRRYGDPLTLKMPTFGLSVEGHFRHYMPGDPPPAGVVWKWAGTVAENGYGQLHVQHKTILAHRVAYELFVGPIPAGLVVRHKLDIPIDVNPHNLELGTHADNSRDRAERGRQARGERVGGAKLTGGQVLQIRSMSEGGMSARQIADIHDVTAEAIGQIIRRQTWKHI